MLRLRAEKSGDSSMGPPPLGGPEETENADERLSVASQRSVTNIGIQGPLRMSR